MNLEKLEQLKSWLLAGTPERQFNMNQLLEWEVLELPPKERNWCGTSCCMAGYVVTAMCEDVLLTLEEIELEDIGDKAADILGIPRDLANALFYPKVYPEPDREIQHFWPSWSRITAAQAAQALQNVIDRQNPHWEEILK